MENALIIFVRNTEKGQVKTRLSKNLGDDKTLSVYKFLLQYTRDISFATNCSRFVFYSSYIHLYDMFDDSSFTKYVQEGADLGERMMNAFQKVFDLGCKKVCIIGSDCYELQYEMLHNAFEKLDNHDMVIGPSKDGGYYLLGLKKSLPALFSNKYWGTSSVFEDTINIASENGLSYHTLPELNDIDTIEDLLETNILTQLEEGGGE